MKMGRGGEAHKSSDLLTSRQRRCLFHNGGRKNSFKILCIEGLLPHYEEDGLTKRSRQRMSVSQEDLSVASLGEKEERTRCHAFEYLLPKLFFKRIIFLI